MMQCQKRRVFKRAFISLGCIVILFCASVYLADHQDCCGEHRAAYLFTRGYSRELGLTRFDEESILRAYGKPLSRTKWVASEQNDQTLILDQYRSFDVLYVSVDWYEGKHYNDLIQIVVKSNTLRFGRKEIGIGSTKEEVQRAYKRDEKITDEELAYSAVDFPDVDEGYYGEKWSRILFCYGEDGKVISMAMQPSAFWGW